MNNKNRLTTTLFLLLIVSTGIFAQKAEKGSSPDNPWSKEMNHGFNMGLDYRMPLQTTGILVRLVTGILNRSLSLPRR
jgi:hypothetical protein